MESLSYIKSFERKSEWSGGGVNLQSGDDGEEEEGDEIVVTAKFIRTVAFSDEGDPSNSSFSLVPFFYGTDYGPGTPRTDPFNVLMMPASLSPTEIVSRGCEALSQAIKLITDLARPALPAREEARLDALSSALHYASLGLQAGSLDLSSARSLVQTSFATAFNLLEGAGMGALFGALGVYATTLVPSPVLKALGIAGFSALGFAADAMISDSHAADQLAAVLTNGLFAGA